MKFIFYSHGGSGNHGCEAIIRSSIKILDDSGYNDIKKHVFSYAIEEDLKYIGHQENTEFFGIPTLTKNADYYIAALKYKIFKNQNAMTSLRHSRLLKDAENGDIAICIGGDTYTYDGWPELLGAVNNRLRKKNVKTILWGCSLSEELMKNPSTVNDLRNYDLITVRENLTIDILKKEGIEKNVIHVADPAFNLDMIETNLPDIFTTKDGVVGINMSPLSLSCGSSAEIVEQNYLRLIDYIISKTKMGVVLIPHVVWNGNNDVMAMNSIYANYSNNPRVIRIEDNNCCKLKYIISKCRFFVGARTHATIAAYSTYVPTLVVGYSLKAKGIALEIFGKVDDFVVPVQEMKNADELINSFKTIYNNESEIRTRLQSLMPSYKNRSYNAMSLMHKLVGLS